MTPSVLNNFLKREQCEVSLAKLFQLLLLMNGGQAVEGEACCQAAGHAGMGMCSLLNSAELGASYFCPEQSADFVCLQAVIRPWGRQQEPASHGRAFRGERRDAMAGR